MQRRDRTRGFNLSRWALEHPALTRYLMVVLMVLGFAAYFQLGPGRRPAVHLPRDGGAHLLARRHGAAGGRAGHRQARAHAAGGAVRRQDPQLLQAGRVADHLPDQGLVARPSEVANVWYTVRKKIGDMRGTLPPGVQGPFFNDDFGDVYGVIYALRSRRLQLRRAQDLRRRRAPAAAARARRRQGRAVRRAGREDLHRDLAEAPGAARAGPQPGAGAARRSRTRSRAPAPCRRRWTWCRCAWPASSRRSSSCATMPIRGSSGSQLRLGDIAEIKRGYVDPPAVKVRHQGKEVIALGVSMTKGGDIIALGKSLQTALPRRSSDGLPAGMQAGRRSRTSPRRWPPRSTSSCAR